MIWGIWRRCDGGHRPQRGGLALAIKCGQDTAKSVPARRARAVIKRFPIRRLFMRFYSTRLVASVLAIGVGFGTGQAFAVDADATAKALVAAMTAEGKTEVSYADASANGDEVTINEFKATGEDSSVTIPAIVLSGVA